MKKLYNKLRISLLSCLLILEGCTKSNSNTTLNVAHSNLQVYATASVDGTGVVSFSATADNAVSYKYNFGNGDSLIVVSGYTNYQYSLSGTNNYTVTVTAIGYNGLTIRKSVLVGVYVKTGSGNLVWSDEFNTDGTPDQTKWSFDIGAGGWGNSELEFYTSRSTNAIVSNGTLKIVARKESYNGSDYTSARIISKNKFAFTYGRVEVKAKLPSSAGTWPAIWMLGSNIDVATWPSCGEIDIMEQKGSELNKIYGTIHYPGHFGGGGVGSTTTISGASTDFHIYALDWSPTTIKMYVDNQLFFSFANSTSVPFNHDFFCILNLAMGGTFGGTVSSAFTSDVMEVDYIRVYK